MRAAISARVSTDKQGHDQTVDSQLDALRRWATAHGHELKNDHVYSDEGSSGARLDRPARDRLRDAAREGEFDVLGVSSPDRLARRYAYQILLLEEFRKAACDVAFIERPISDDPHDQLLLQIQGAIAEDERAVLAERFRRGKLQKARAGRWGAGRAPYGYRYVPKRDGVPGHLEVDEAEAAVVRMLYRGLIDERMTVRRILQRLAAGPWRPRNGKRLWSHSGVHRIRSDPLSTGTAYAHRHVFVVPRKPRSTGPRAGLPTCRKPRPREGWVPIPVPAIIDEITHQHASDRLARNAVLSFRNDTRNDYLLRCLLTCRTCGLAMCGITTSGAGGRRQYRDYTCHGKDTVARDRACRCPQARTQVEELDTAVWDHVKRLLNDPATLAAQFEERARQAEALDADAQAAGQKWEAQLRRLDREEQRLLDAYQAEAIDLDELKQRREPIRGRRLMITAQRDQEQRLRCERQTAKEVRADLTAFCERVRARLDEATLAEGQQILRWLIDRVIVGEDSLEIRHVIPLGRLKAESASPGPTDPARSGGGEGSEPEGTPPIGLGARLRSDGVGQTELEQHPELAPVATRGGEVVTAQHPVELRPQDRDQHVRTACRIDLEQRVQTGPKAPGPLPLAVLLVAGLIDVEPRLAGEVVEQLLIRSLQRPADLGDDPGQFAARDRHPHDVAEELADGGVGGVAGPLEVGDPRGQGRPDQPATRDPQRGRGLVHLPTVRAPSRMTTMLFDRQRDLAEVNLLDHPRCDGQRGVEVMAARGAGVEVMIERPAVDRLGRECGALMLGMPGLPADAAFVLALGWWRLGRLDDVG
jgi:site-specific DNA recombinase